MGEYCKIHKIIEDDDELKGCPLCDSMIRHVAALSRWKEKYTEMRTLLKGWLDAEDEPRRASHNLISRTKEAIK